MAERRLLALRCSQTLEACKISHGGESAVDPLAIHFVFREDGEGDAEVWEEPSDEPLSKPTTSL